MSLNKRLLITSFVILITFLGLVGVVLEGAFKQSLEDATKERLMVYVYALMSAAEMNRDGQIEIRAKLPDARFYEAKSGLYAQIYIHQKDAIWRSESCESVHLPNLLKLPQGDILFETTKLQFGDEMHSLSYGVIWELDSGEERAYTFNVQEVKHKHLMEVSRFRQYLWGGLLFVLLLLMIAQWQVLRWGLRPFARVSTELAKVEKGEKRQIKGHYPAEIQGLIDNLNHLLEHEQTERERHKNSLSDLAHSLKTPLSVLMNHIEAQGADANDLKEHVERMNGIISYQLQRAATSGKSVMKRSVNIKRVIERLLAALAKVYTDKQISYFTEFSGDGRFYGEEDDAMECLGNILENAFKYCRRLVKVKVYSETREKVPHLYIQIEDDGPGVPEAMYQSIKQRGVRIEKSKEGQGIGLDIACNIISAYGGTIDLEMSKMGGVRFTLIFPKPV